MRRSETPKRIHVPKKKVDKSDGQKRTSGLYSSTPNQLFAHDGRDCLFLKALLLLTGTTTGLVGNGFLSTGF
jgi:hypothetical protein